MSQTYSLFSSTTTSSEASTISRHLSVLDPRMQRMQRMELLTSKADFSPNNIRALNADTYELQTADTRVNSH